MSNKTDSKKESKKLSRGQNAFAAFVFAIFIAMGGGFDAKQQVKDTLAKQNAEYEQRNK